MEPKTIEMAALGRSLYPGMLYDCRSDSFIPGVTLWDKASLTQDLDIRKQPNTDLKFSASDSLSDKASLLDVSASLKASFFGGLVEVGGSAKYLNHKKCSEKQSRVTMQYSQRTKFEQLTMTQLGKITYPEVFEQKTATHVVTSVLYGSQVFMVFDRTNADTDNKQEVEGNLNVLVKKIPSFSMEGEGALKMNEYEKKLAESISCTFYGDCVLEENPTTYIEALQIYKKLPTLLRQKENDAVPVRVWLYPLTHLDSRAAKLEREISATLISDIQSVLEELGNAERKVRDLFGNKMVNDFEDVKDRLRLFQRSVEDYKLLFQKALSRILPAIRGSQNEKEMEKLTNILLIHQRSPFSTNKLKKWLDDIHAELNLLNTYTSQLDAVQVITSSVKFDEVIFDPRVDTVVCFSFTSLDKDPYLSTITEFLKIEDLENLNLISETSDQDIQAWFRNSKIYEKMRRNFYLFKSFFEVNQGNKKNKFVIAPVSDSPNPGASIRLYRNGQMKDNNFQPVSKPSKPSVSIQNRDVILKLQKSPTGETIQYRVEYRATQPPGDSGADSENWEFRVTPDAQETFTLTGLQFENQYHVRYRAVGHVGMSEASDSSDVFSLREESDPGASFCIELRNRILTSLGTSKWSLSTIQSELTNRVSDIVIPYEGAISDGLKPGMGLFLRGVVPKDGEDFIINLKTKSGEDGDIAFQFKFHFETCTVVCNSFKKGERGKPEETRNAPLRKGNTFNIFMVIHPEHYEVIVNGQVFPKVKHRIPLKRVSVMNITGNVDMNTFSIIEVDNIIMKVTVPPLNVTIEGADLFK
ncbi:stonustoxin subunit alpha-like [Astyanax mexicanus]|uniref:Stonustoxin subunit alpha-like n=1 Tax=Astyanax mexicanus TaxID=7994 RepID=A0A8T2KUZ3_ASTMX|nr:stonustoxin subunit alpha-like [Astyanax mexicanus]